MKFLKKFLEYLDIQELKPDIKLEHYDKNGNKVYKGINKYNSVIDYKKIPDTFLIDPTKTQRISKGKISEVIKYVKIWQRYNRPNSLICTTNKKSARSWTSSDLFVYEVIPTKDEIYICPGEDFNYRESWDYYRSKIGIYANPALFLDGVVAVVKFHIFDEIDTKYSYNEHFGKAIEYFNDNYDKISNLTINKSDFYKNEILDSALEIIRLSKDYNNLQDMMNDLFDPIKNGFKKIKYSEFQKSNEYKDNEVWFNCECVIKKIKH